PALVFAYCTIGSPHDQYFYRRPDRMVGGEVALPRLDMANEALVRAHVHAVWLAETGAWLGHSLKDVLQVSGSPPTLALVTDLQQKTADPGARRRAAQRLSRLLETIQADLAQADWFGDDWLSHTLERAAEGLDRACDRWRGLYRAALKQQAAQNAIITDASRSERDKVQARRLRAEAESQLSLLTGDGPVRTYQSDFYSYRYFASEGFLPGYSFPRLPLSAYIPARRQRADARDEFLSRPRFLAISEFGPRSIIYHEGSRYVVHKAILPVDDDLLTSRAKRCDACGYLHPLPGEAPGPDLCEHCRCSLQPAMVSLFRMQNVSTKRRDRISCDEEERLRQGYEMVTGVRFADYGDRPGRRVATVRTASGDALFRLTYGDAATLWRINLGWSRRRDRAVQGFLLDVERGYWASNKDAEEEENEDPLSPRTERVIPYVEDRRNALLIEPAEPLPRAVMASLQPALKTAIQVTYQLEESELAAEPLPSTDDRRVILFYESAEGGAGVLRQLVADTQALPRIAVEALAICHYDPTTGEDLRRAPQSSEDCEAACYDCLMSYSNQPDHRLLDRHQVRDLLQRLASAVVEASPTPLERSRHLGVLLAACESELERHWLELLDRHGLRLPDAAQETIAHVFTRPDFLYREHYVAVYIDGPDHDPPEAAAHDAELDRTLADRGYTVLRFGYRQRDRWLETCRRHPYVFGTPVGGVATHGDR
ncbi:MAG: Zn-binding domain-containing protein, partial [Thiobacillaceae bacterium]